MLATITSMKGKSSVFILFILLSLPCFYAFFLSSSRPSPATKTAIRTQVGGPMVPGVSPTHIQQQKQRRNPLTMRVSSHNNGKFPGGNSILSTNKNNMADNDQPSVVYVANLPYAATVEEIEQFFSSCGPVVDVKIIRDQYTKRSKGYCFIKFSEAIHATVAIEEFNGKDFMGRAVTCRPAFRSGGYSSSSRTTNYDDDNDNNNDYDNNVQIGLDDDDDFDMNANTDIDDIETEEEGN